MKKEKTFEFEVSTGMGRTKTSHIKESLLEDKHLNILYAELIRLFEYMPKTVQDRFINENQKC